MEAWMKPSKSRNKINFFGPSRTAKVKVKSWNTFKLFADSDRDGVANVFDCKPHNKRKQDVIYSIQRKQGIIHPSEKQKDYGRGTGHFGTGIYGFQSKEKARAVMKDKDYHYARSGGNVVAKIEIKKPLIIKGGHDEGMEFHDAMRDIRRLKKITSGPMKGRVRIVSPYDSRTQTIGDDPRRIIRQLEAQGVKGVTIKELVRAKKIKEETGISPANTVLGRRGFTGVIPPKELDNLSYGAVKFKHKIVPLEEDHEDKSETLKALDEPTEAEEYAEPEIIEEEEEPKSKSFDEED